jgi:hypothetical protein
MKKLLVLCLIAGLTATGSILNLKAADDSPAPAGKSEKKAPAPRHIPFHGKVDTLDKEGGTLKIGDRTFHVTAATKITKAGKPANFDAAAVGEHVGGAYQMGEGGRLEVTSLRIGPKPTKEPTKDDETKP